MRCGPLTSPLIPPPPLSSFDSFRISFRLVSLVVRALQQAASSPVTQVSHVLSRLNLQQQQQQKPKTF